MVNTAVTSSLGASVQLIQAFVQLLMLYGGKAQPTASHLLLIFGIFTNTFYIFNTFIYK